MIIFNCKQIAVLVAGSKSGGASRPKSDLGSLLIVFVKHCHNR